MVMYRNRMNGTMVIVKQPNETLSKQNVCINNRSDDARANCIRCRSKLNKEKRREKVI